MVKSEEEVRKYPYVIKFPPLKVERVEVAYERLCPICGNGLTLSELSRGFCKKYFVPLLEPKWKAKLKELEDFFRRAFGSEMRTIQRSWAKKLLLGLSFGITAPTGTGKTVFGLIMALKYRNSLVIFPTKALVAQAKRILDEAVERLGKSFEAKILYYHGDMTKSEKTETLKRIEEGDYDILVITNQFLVSNFQLISDRRFKLIFVDDLDSMARSSKNVDKILRLLGFSNNDIWRAKNLRNLRDHKFPKPEGQLIISSATLKKGENTRLFSRLLGFDVGSSQNFLRKVYDLIVGKPSLDLLERYLKVLGPGGLIFADSQEEAEKLTEELKKRDFRVEMVSSKSSKHIEDFARGKLDFLVGVASPYGILVRGIDLPLRIKYAVFWRLPKRATDLSDLSKYKDNKLLLRFLGRVFMGKLSPQVEELQRVVDEHPEGLISTFVLKEKKLYSIDLNTYLQATGRTSRFMPWGITRGLSLIFDEPEFLEAMRKVGYIHNIDFEDVDRYDLEGIKEELEETRKPKETNSGLLDLKTYLLIVESPTKAKQIASFFGKPAMIKLGNAMGYEVATPWGIVTVMPSFGHVTDLTVGKGLDGVEVEGKKFIPIFEPILKCEDCGHQFVAGFSLMPPKPFSTKVFLKRLEDDMPFPPWMEPIIFRGLMNPFRTDKIMRCPICGSPNLRDSKDQIEALRKATFILENVIVATDPDNEGEKISFDLKSLLSGYWKTSFRARFHEITRKALEEAIANVSDVDLNLVNSQLARRIEDRWIGFRLSGEIQQHFNHYNLSAGRVQTPVLGWVIEQFDKYQNEKIPYTHIVDIDLVIDGEKLSGEVEVEIEELDREEEEFYVKPFNTSDLLIEASRILKLSTDAAMRYAQYLFERGLITYHRTDSYHISDKGIAVAKQFLGDKFVYHNYPEEGAHETIRPTKPLTFDDIRMNYEMEWNAIRLYDLIFRRFMASQSGPVKVTYQNVRVRVRSEKEGKVLQGEHKRLIEAKGSALELYPWVAWVREPLQPGKFKMKAKGGKRPSVPLLTQADLVRMMKERGIGRPSTYSTIITKLFKRGYIFENKVGKIIPTKLGREVYKYLKERFGEFVSEDRTRQLQEKMDMIEKGEITLPEVLNELIMEMAKI